MSFRNAQQDGVVIKNAGVTVANPGRSLNFTGAGVTATAINDAATATIPGGAGTPVFSEALGTGDGTTTVFALVNTPVSSSAAIYKNGQRMNVGAANDYTISGKNVTFATAPANGDVLLADYQW